MLPKFTFGIIVLNGEPFTRYCIRGLYQHAHEIIIVEGACEGARKNATKNGHSTDGTLELLIKLKEQEDPEGKITIITAEDEGYESGFWPGEKDEQSAAFAKRATGQFLWQVDIDEFFREEDILKIKELLSSANAPTCIAFRQKGFWGGFNYLVDTWYFKRHLPDIYRIFRWGPGFKYISHRPPTVIDNQGVNQKDLKFLSASATAGMGIYMYHYSFVFPKQVIEKANYYSNADWSKRKEAEWWANEIYNKLTDPYRVFSVSWIPGWIVRFRGRHPEIIYNMIDDINKGVITIELRRTDDIEKLLKSLYYKAGVFFLTIGEPFDRIFNIVKKKARKTVKKMLGIKNK